MDALTGLGLAFEHEDAQSAAGGGARELSPANPAPTIATS